MKHLVQKKSLLILVGIIFIASVLRLWQLGAVPLSPDWDEVSLGYNAYSIIQTGRDEYGKLLPIVLESFGDYKPALYSYVAIPSISMFGLNSFAVRLPSAIFGILTVLATYFLVKEVFSITGNKTKRYAVTIALLSALLLAISPWHIQFSRAAFESNVGLAFNVVGTLLFLYGLRNHWFLVLSALFFGLNLSVYQSERVFTPLLVILLLFVFRKQFFAVKKKYLTTAVIVGIIAVSPFLYFVATNNDALSRAKSVSIFTQETVLVERERQSFLEDKQNNDALGTIFHSIKVLNAKSIIGAYTSHFDFNWLFITGDNARHHAPNMGLLYLWELPFLLLGIYLLLFGAYKKEIKLLIFGWFLLAAVPASVTQDVPHAVRTTNFMPMFQIFIAIGLVAAWEFVNNLKQVKGKWIIGKYLFYGMFILTVGFNFIYYLNQYFVQQNYFHAKDWQYGYEELIPKVKAMEASVDKIIVSNTNPLDQSYIFFLFYTKMNPAEYQKVSFYERDTSVRKFEKYEFRPIKWEKDHTMKNVLFIGSEKDFPSELKPVNTIYYPDGSVAIKLIKNE